MSDTQPPRTPRNRSIGAITLQNLSVCTGPCMPGAPCPTVTGRVEIRDTAGVLVLQWDDRDIDLTLREMRTKETFDVGPHLCTTLWYDGQVDLVVHHSLRKITLSQSQDDYWLAVEAAESAVDGWSAMSPERIALEEYRQSLLH